MPGCSKYSVAVVHAGLPFRLQFMSPLLEVTADPCDLTPACSYFQQSVDHIAVLLGICLFHLRMRPWEQFPPLGIPSSWNACYSVITG